MAERYIVVLDAGSSAVRCHVFDKSGRIVATEAGAWAYRPTDDISPYAREFRCGRHLAPYLRDDIARVTRVWRLAERGRCRYSHEPAPGGRLPGRGRARALRWAEPRPPSRLRRWSIDEEMGSRVYTTTGHTPSFLFAPAQAAMVPEQSARPLQQRRNGLDHSRLARGTGCRA